MSNIPVRNEAPPAPEEEFFFPEFEEVPIFGNGRRLNNRRLEPLDEEEIDAFRTFAPIGNEQVQSASEGESEFVSEELIDTPRTKC